MHAFKNTPCIVLPINKNTQPLIFIHIPQHDDNYHKYTMISFTIDFAINT